MDGPVFYGLDDPLDIIQQPWKSDRWREHCRKAVTEYWLRVLLESCETYSTLDLFDTSRLDLSSPHPIWTAAGRDDVATRRATYCMWLLLGVYNTAERMHKMKLARTPYCVLCHNDSASPVVENRAHFLLSCPALREIREDFFNQFNSLSPVLMNHREVSNDFLICLLDPFSQLVVDEVRLSWVSAEKIYATSRNFCYAMHNRRTKLIEAIKT